MNKKVYVKPDAMLVDFSLSSSIAATCKHTATMSDSSCNPYSIDGGWIVMTTGNFVCELTPDDPTFCYHVPTEDTSVFSS